MKATEVTAAWQKVMASLWRDSLHVTCGLTACTPGSAPGLTLGNEYGKTLLLPYYRHADPWWLGSRVVSVLDLGAEGPGFKSQPRRCSVTVLGKLFTPIVHVFTKQRNW